jgi:hypothetical protein
MEPCKYVIAGEESYDNLRLSQILKQAYGKDNVIRFLDLESVEPFLISHPSNPLIVCLDLFSFGFREVTDFIGYIRNNYAKVVFNLYVEHEEYKQKSKDFPVYWKKRFLHYFKTFKEGADAEFEPVVRASLMPSQNEAMSNMAYEPVRITPVFKRGLVEIPAEVNHKHKPTTTFISYSRDDWSGFVSGLVSDLARDSHKVWVDQDYIFGGDDWLDAIGEALQVCDNLLLVLSPDALNSRFVKMEYRFFFHQEKPIIPILYRNVAQLPFELATLQFIDFTQEDRLKSYSSLFRALSRT